MEPLLDLQSYFGMFAAATVAGALGGFAFELMPANSKCHMGSIRAPHRLEDKHSFDLGFLSSLLLGAVTAVAFLYFFPPETQTITRDASGMNHTGYSYDLVKLVALSLIVGSAGPSFLSSIQGRLLGALNAQKEFFSRELDKVREGAGATVTEVAEQKRQRIEEVVREKATKMQSPAMVPASGNGNGKAVLETDQAAAGMANAMEDIISGINSICVSAEAEVKSKIDAVVEDAKKAINK